jgi:hypothetical protein
MLIRRVSATAFGGLRDAELELADGLTVIYGPNESGKSTWHAAVLAALCGRWPSPGARGEPGIERRRPWSGRDWAVGAEIRLADGRRVALQHDLDARLGTAHDLDIVADLTREIAGPRGVPDATRWLGLDRTAFVATACVRQSRLALATEQARGVATFVERAASTAAADQTAAGALARIDEFRRVHVGTDRSTTRPLQLAGRVRDEAEHALQAAQGRQADLDGATTQARTLRDAADAALVRLREAQVAAAQAAQRTELARAQAEATRTQEEALRLASRAEQARELSAALATPPPVPAPRTPAEPAAPPGARRPRRPVLLLSGAASLLVIAVLLVALDAPLAAVAPGVVALVLGAVGLVRWGRASVPQALAPAAAPAVDEDRLLAWQEATTRRARLEALLDGGTVADLAGAAQRAQVASNDADARAVRLAGSVHSGPSSVSAADDRQVEVLRAQYQEAERDAALAEQAAALLAKDATPVVEAEERLEAAGMEVARLRDLDVVLARTAQYLARAQERVHRDIAPELAAAVGRDLAAVTGGRYVEAVVDPASLAVQVRASGGALRDVDALSVGTAEQVYLLLRVALAQRLVRTGESCPLLLDDVTVHADPQRTARLLEVLLAVAARHQVVLFTQQDQVRGWAQAHLTEPRHGLRELSSPALAVS